VSQKASGLNLPVIGLSAALLLVGLGAVMVRSPGEARVKHDEAYAVWRAWCETQGHNERCAERLDSNGERCFGLAFVASTPRTPAALDPQVFVSCVEVGFRPYTAQHPPAAKAP
jgi:hypothetical protein